jgi:putative hydrolase of the HAD superfamily
MTSAGQRCGSVKRSYHDGMATLFFDFGNVIGFFDHRIAVRKLILDCDLDENACFRAIYDTDLEDIFEAGRVGAHEFIRRSSAAINYRGTTEHFRAAFEDIFWPNQEVSDLIPRLAKQHRLVLASNTNEIHAAFFRKTFADVLQHFAALGLSYHARARKPARAFFEYCQQFANCPPAECLFIDDLQANVEGGRAFGWRTIRYTGYPDLLKQLHSLGIDPG